MPSVKPSVAQGRVGKSGSERQREIAHALDCVAIMFPLLFCSTVSPSQARLKAP